MHRFVSYNKKHFSVQALPFPTTTPSGFVGQAATERGSETSIYGHNNMKTLPRLDKKLVAVTNLDDNRAEKEYWLAKSPAERLNAIELQRRMIYGRNRTASRLQKTFDVINLSEK